MLKAAAAAALIDAGADVEAVTPEAATSALMQACASGAAAAAAVLIERGAEVNRTASPKAHGGTALYLAAQGMHVSVLRLLLRAGPRLAPRLSAACERARCW